MSKYDYDDYLDEDPFFNPCEECGSLDFYMDWEDSTYKCNSCDTPVNEKPVIHVKKEKSKSKIKKFREEID